MTRLHACAALVAIALATCPSPATAQWEVGLGIGAPRFSGGAVEPTTGLSLRPYRPTVFEAGVDRTGRRVGMGVWFHYASSSLAFEGEDGCLRRPRRPRTRRRIDCRPRVWPRSWGTRRHFEGGGRRWSRTPRPAPVAVRRWNTTVRPVAPKSPRSEAHVPWQRSKLRR